MGIPESKLQTWSNPGATTTATLTYDSVKAALVAPTSPVRERDFEVYLQGSYRNATNIRGDSDVDIVVQLNSAFRSNYSDVPQEDRPPPYANFSAASYGWSDFRNDVVNALRAYYDTNLIVDGNKSVKVTGASGRLNADLVVCVQYRNYKSLQSSQDPFAEGITFWATRESRWIVNYPKLHYQKGVDKNSETDGLYKQTIRLFKNARTHLVDSRTIDQFLAPSYFVECLLYNVPADRFAADNQTDFCNVVNWLAGASLSSFLCQNEQVLLFGNMSEQWTETKARALQDALVNLWNHW